MIASKHSLLTSSAGIVLCGPPHNTTCSFARSLQTWLPAANGGRHIWSSLCRPVRTRYATLSSTASYWRICSVVETGHTAAAHQCRGTQLPLPVLMQQYGFLITDRENVKILRKLICSLVHKHHGKAKGKSGESGKSGKSGKSGGVILCHI